MSMLWIQWLCSYCWSFFEFLDILSGIRISHRIHKTCNSLTCKLFVCQLITKLPIYQCSRWWPLFLSWLIVLAALLLQLYLEFCIQLPTSFNHFLKMFITMVSIFSVLLFLQPHAQTAFFFTFVTLIGNVPPKCFLIELGCKIMNKKKKKIWHDIMLLYNLKYVSQWDNRFRW